MRPQYNRKARLRSALTHLGDIDFFRRSNICFQDSLHKLQRTLVFRFGLRGDAVGRNHQPVVAHVRVVCREQDADVGRKARQNQSLSPQMFQKQIERGVTTSRRLRIPDR